MRETLSILKDFSIDHLYLILSSGPEETSWKDKALANFEKLDFFGEFDKDDFKKMLDWISSSNGFSIEQFRTLFYPLDEEYT